MDTVVSKNTSVVNSLTVSEALETPLFGVIESQCFCKGDQKWVQQSLGDWMRTLPGQKSWCDTLAKRAVDSPDAYKELKGKAHGFQFFHTAPARSYAAAVEHAGSVSGIWIVDIDHIAQEHMQAVQNALLELPACVGVGVSLSRRGLAAAMCYTPGDDAAINGAYAERVFNAVSAYADTALEALGLSVAADKDAKNGVRWRFCLQSPVFPPMDRIVEPVEIPETGQTATQTGQTATQTGQTDKRLDNALAALTGSALADGHTRNRRLNSAIFAAFDAGMSNDEVACVVRPALEAAAPKSSRLKGDELPRLIADLRTKKPKEKNRNVAAEWFKSWRFDTFTRRFFNPDGVAFTLDDAAAQCCRACDEMTLNAASEAAVVWVKNNPPKQFDSLTERVQELAAAYTPADDGAIAAYAARCGLDAYETRRLTLWLYQICGRAIKRGEKTDGMLVLTGPQGAGKSQFFDGIARTLTGSGAPAYSFAAGKDGEILLASAPVVVIDEIDRVLRKSDVAELKTRITATQSCVRAPYDRDPQTRLNCAVFGATTNDATPIPAGEGEARRYWVVAVNSSIRFTSAEEPAAMMREAAHAVCTALEAVGEAYDPVTTAGKVWVSTPKEDAETAERNRAAKVEDSATIAISAALDALSQFTRGPEGQRLHGLKALATAINTGDSRGLGICASWPAPDNRAADVRRLIAARCQRRIVRYHGAMAAGVVAGVVAGYTLADLANEFGEHASEAETADDVTPFDPAWPEL